MSITVSVTITESKPVEKSRPTLTDMTQAELSQYVNGYRFLSTPAPVIDLEPAYSSPNWSAWHKAHCPSCNGIAKPMTPVRAHMRRLPFPASVAA